MALITCRECQKEVSDQAPRCPHCGAPVEGRPKKGSAMKVVAILGVVVVGFLTFGAVVGGSPEGQAMTKDRRAIDYCWEEQKRKSLDPSAQRFVAGACEMMEEKFRKTYGRSP